MFRKEALEFLNKHDDSYLLAPNINYTYIVIFIIFIMFSSVYLIFNSTYSEKRVVNGWIETLDPTVKIFANGQKLVVQKVLVQEGEYVTKGQPLLLLDNEPVKGADGFSDIASTLKYLSKKKITQEKDIDNTITYYNVKKDFIKAKQKILTKQTPYYLNSLDKINQLEILTKKKLQRLNVLLKNEQISQSEFDQVSYDEHMNLLSNTLREQQIMDTMEASSLYSIQLKEADIESKQKLAELNSNLDAINKEIEKIKSTTSKMVLSTSAGVVENIQTYEGLSVEDDVPLMIISPKKSPLVVKLIIPVESSGFVEEFQQVNFKVVSFPYEKYGILRGKISDISKVIYLPNEMLDSPIPIVKPSFLSIAEIPNSTPIPIKPGMLVQAEIIVDERKIWEWILRPISSITF